MSSAAAVATSIEHRHGEKVHREPGKSLVFFGVLGLLLFAPLPFGSVQPWAILTLEAGAVLLFGLWTVGQFIAGEIEIAWSSTFPPMAAFAALIVLQLATRQTAYRFITVSTFLLAGSYGLLHFLIVQSLRHRWQIKVSAVALSAYGCALAVFAMIQDLSSSGKLYWAVTPRFGGWIYGPYVNHNHYAGLMEMLTPIPLLIALSPRVHRQHKVLAGFAAAIMASTIILSGSRGGMLALTVQIIFLLGFFVVRRPRAKAVFPIGAILIVALGLLLWLGDAELFQRMSSVSRETHTELSGGMRLNIDKDCLKMFAKKPVTGWGLGVFPEIYPQFRSFYTNFLIDKAHNDYLQLLVETGILGFAIMLWFLFSVYRPAIRKLKDWPMDFTSEVALAALLGISGILVHSFVDFNLQIPANAALFFVLCGAANLERLGPHRGHHHRHSLPED